MTKERYWRIRGYDGSNKIFDESIPVGCLSEGRLEELLKCLAAKGGLSYREIVGAYVRRKTKLAHELLQVHKNGPHPEYSCGHDPSFVAILADEDGERVDYPSLQ